VVDERRSFTTFIEKKSMQNSIKFVVFSAAIGCAVGNVLAQSANFLGTGVGLSVASQTSKIDRDPMWTSDISGNDTNANLVGSFGFEITPQWVGTVGLTLDLKKTRLYEQGADSATGKQRLSISFAPGYRLGTNGLAYGKLSIHSMTVDYSSAGAGFSRTHQGYGLGFGYGHAISKNIELRGEYSTEIYAYMEAASAAVKLAPKQNNVAFSLLYKF